MYNTNDSAYFNVKESMKNFILIGLVILLVFSLMVGYFLAFLGTLEGAELGRIIFSLFILSEIPILVNYIYFIICRFGLQTSRIARIFVTYYTPGLLFHSGIYTIVLGLTFAHSLLVIQQSFYCIVFMFILGLLWIIDFILYSKSWPLYPSGDQRAIYLYWLQWVVLFGLVIGIPFHAKAWSLFWVSIFPTFAFGPLLVVIFQDLRNKRANTQKSRKLETQNPVTRVIKW